MSRATAPDAHFYADPMPTRDKAAQALSAVQKAYRKDWPDEDPDTLLWSVQEVDKDGKPV